MNNQTGWMVYCITRIDTRKPTFLTIDGPVKISSYHSALAAALVRYGHREFFWEVAGPFDTRNEAREIREKMIHAWTINPKRTPEEVPYTVDELRGYRGRPRIITPGSPETREEFMEAARDRLAVNKDYRDKYLDGYVAPEADPTRARKTDDQKALTKMYKRQRRHQKKLLARAAQVAAINDEFSEMW